VPDPVLVSNAEVSAVRSGVPADAGVAIGLPATAVPDPVLISNAEVNAVRSGVPADAGVDIDLPTTAVVALALVSTAAIAAASVSAASFAVATATAAVLAPAPFAGASAFAAPFVAALAITATVSTAPPTVETSVGSRWPAVLWLVAIDSLGVTFTPLSPLESSEMRSSRSRAQRVSFCMEFSK